jgi:hypothetical protein
VTGGGNCSTMENNLENEILSMKEISNALEKKI